MSHRFAQVDRYDHLQEDALRKKASRLSKKSELHDNESVVSFDKALMYICIPTCIGQPTRRNTLMEWIVPFSSFWPTQNFQPRPIA